MYGDVMAMFKKTWGDFTLDAAIGGSINDRIRNSTRYDSKNASLKFANVFNIANIIMNSSASIDQKIDEHRQLQSIFGTAQIGYKEKLFLDFDDNPEQGFIANERQKNCLEKSLENVIEAKEALDEGVLLDGITVLLDSAAEKLMELTGEKASEAVVDDVFSRFCVGK